MTAVSVIVCSYGTPKATHKALRRLRAMLSHDDQLIVYAGTRMGTADSGQTKGVDVVETIGQAGLLDALNLVTSDLVLHVIDGVTLSAGTMRKLVQRASQTGKLAVPWTNDIGTDHYAGALPVHGNIVPALTELGRRMPDDAVARVVRPVCIAGSLSQIRGLVPFHLSYPTTILRLVYEDCIVVGGAVAAHDGSAETRLAAPEGPAGRPLLVASMIVRDEEDFLEDCLRSLDGLVDRIDLCDTGSTDRTLEIARAFGCNIIEREWRDDFGWARNEVLEESRDAWYSLWVDADERVVCDDVEQVRRQLATSVDHFDVFAISLTSPTDDQHPDETLGNWTTTRILSPETMRYEGALHEQVVRRDAGTNVEHTTLEGLSLVHLGYSAEVIESRDKTARNLAIAQSMYDANPEDPVTALQYARSLTLAGSAPEARVTALRRADAGYGDADPQTRSFVKGLLALALGELGEFSESMSVAEDALDMVPAEDSAFRALLVAAMKQDQIDRMLERLDTYAHGPSLPPAISEPSMRAGSRGEAVKVLLARGDVQAALDHTREMIAEGLRRFPHWTELFDGLLTTLPAEELVDEIHHLIQSTSDGSWVRPLATRVRHNIVLPLVVAHVDAAAHADPEVVRVGLTMAMIRDDDEAFRSLARQVDVLSPDDRAALSARLRERGNHELAAITGPTPTFAAVGAPAFKL